MAKAGAQRPGWDIPGRCGPRSQGLRTSRTQHSCGLRRPSPVGPRGGAGHCAPAGPDTHSFPGPWPFESASGSLPEGSVPLGRAHGRGGSSGDSSLCSGRRSGGGRADFGRVLRHRARYLGTASADPVSIPRPTSGAWPVQAPRFRSKRARPTSHPSGRLPGLRPRTPDRTHGPVTTGGHRCGWPPGLPLGVGSPAVPGLSASRNG